MVTLSALESIFLGGVKKTPPYLADPHPVTKFSRPGYIMREHFFSTKTCEKDVYTAVENFASLSLAINFSRGKNIGGGPNDPPP